jgi:hypothetical protein
MLGNKQGSKQLQLPSTTFVGIAAAIELHENGQNNHKIKDARKYAEAYDVAAVWLLIGEETSQKKSQPRHKHNCVEHIHAAALLLKDDSNNKTLLKKN